MSKHSRYFCDYTICISGRMVGWVIIHWGLEWLGIFFTRMGWVYKDGWIDMIGIWFDWGVSNDRRRVWWEMRFTFARMRRIDDGRWAWYCGNSHAIDRSREYCGMDRMTLRSFWILRCSSFGYLPFCGVVKTRSESHNLHLLLYAMAWWAVHVCICIYVWWWSELSVRNITMADEVEKVETFRVGVLYGRCGDWRGGVERIFLEAHVLWSGDLWLVWSCIDWTWHEWMKIYLGMDLL